MLGAKQDFCSKILDAKDDFFSNILGVKLKTFVQPFWVQSKTFVQTSLTEGQHRPKAGKKKMTNEDSLVVLHQEVGFPTFPRQKTYLSIYLL